MTDDAVIFARPCVNHPDLSVSVARTIIGTYRMVFRDDEAGAIIETRIFTSCMRAYDAAQLLINQP
jgi:hypothetical protein